MPTFEWQERFGQDLKELDPGQQAAFRNSVRQFVEDMQRGTFRNGLRVKPVQGRKGVWEMTWADDGRATFAFGAPRIRGERHVIWRRVGTHDVFRDA